MLSTSDSRPSWLEAIWVNSPCGIVTFGLDGLITSANPKALEILGYAQFSDLTPTFFIDLFSANDRYEVSRALSEDRSRRPESSIECKILRHAVIPIPIELRFYRVVLPEPDGSQWICYFHDITHHFEVEQALRISEQRYRFLVEYQGEGVMIIDAAEKIDYINAACGALFGGTPDTLIGQSVTNFIPESQINRFRMQKENRRKGISSSYELSIHSLDNYQREVLVTATPRYTAEGIYGGSLAIFRDITERKRLEEQLRYQSTHDTKTNLFNRTFFDEALNHYDPRVSPPASIIVVDMDGLKEVADPNGQKTGDFSIQSVAKILKEIFHHKGIIARIGSDEFAILMYATAEARLQQSINLLRHMLEKANTSLPDDQQVIFSIGCATTSKTRDITQALMLADLRMYREKKRKKTSHADPSSE